MLGGVAGRHAERVLAAAPSADPSPVLVVLASNLPALAVQPLLPILARRRPALLKSPSAEPLFAAAFAAALVRREPALGEAVAALTWRGGQAALEEPLLAAAGRVLAYGDAAAIADLRRRAPAKLVAYGPQTSLAVLGAGADVRRAAAGLARDVALFDQRGCLSVAAVYTTGDAEELAAALAGELAELARRWPPGPRSVAEAAAVRQVRDEASLRGLRLADLPLAAGTVIVEADDRLRPTPGLRTVRVHRLAAAAELPRLLAAWHGRLQGVALAGFDAAAAGGPHRRPARPRRVALRAAGRAAEPGHALAQRRRRSAAAAGLRVLRAGEVPAGRDDAGAVHGPGVERVPLRVRVGYELATMSRRAPSGSVHCCDSMRPTSLPPT